MSPKRRTGAGAPLAWARDTDGEFPEQFVAAIAPVSHEIILNFIAERVLELPRSY